MPNEFTHTRIDASETTKPVQLSFYPNDHQTDLKEQELQFKGVDDCHGWINDNWQDTGLDDGTGWMSILRFMNDGEDTRTIRIGLEVLPDDTNKDYFRFVSMELDKDGTLSFMSFGQASAVGEYKRTQIKALTKKLLTHDLTADDLYVLFELELEN